MEKPYKSIYAGNSMNQNINDTEEEIVSAFNHFNSVVFGEFGSKKSAHDFVKKFPKYMGLYPTMYTTVLNENGKLQSKENYLVEFKANHLEGATSEAKESGRRKIRSLIRILKKEGLIS